MCCVDRLNPSHVFDAPGKPSPRQALPTFNDVALDDSTSLLWDATEVFECHQRVLRWERFSRASKTGCFCAASMDGFTAVGKPSPNAMPSAEDHCKLFEACFRLNLAAAHHPTKNHLQILRLRNRRMDRMIRRLAADFDDLREAIQVTGGALHGVDQFFSGQVV